MKPPAGLTWAEYRLPLAMPTTAGGAAERRGLILGLDGALGEAAPLPGLHEERLEDLPGLLSQLSLPLDLEGNARDMLERMNDSPGFAALPPSLRFGIESAFLEREAARSGIPIQEYLWPQTSVAVRRSVGLFAGAPDEAATQLAAGEFERYAGVKIKIGRATSADDIRTVEIFRSRWPEAEIRLDANRSLNRATVAELSRAVSDLGVRFIEEPFADPADLEAYLAADEGLPVALDESLVAAVRAGHRPLTSPRVAAWVIKPSCLGLWPSLQLIESAGDVEAIISSSFESSVGTGMLCALAAGSPAHPGLGTDRWFPVDLGGEHLSAWKFPAGGCS